MSELDKSLKEGGMEATRVDTIDSEAINGDVNVSKGLTDNTLLVAGSAVNDSSEQHSTISLDEQWHQLTIEEKEHALEYINGVKDKSNQRNTTALDEQLRQMTTEERNMQLSL